MKSLDKLYGLIEWGSRSKSKFYPFGTAMNGMTSRPEAIRQIIFSLDIAKIVETGTYRGTTTEWFAQFGIPVETIEISYRFYAFSRQRLRNYKNVKLIRDSSISYLRDRVQDGSVSDASRLFYLDAHWLDYLPLKEELELIFANYSQSIVVVDDFKVEDDHGYGFDNYGEGKALTLDYVARCKVPPLFSFFPATVSAEETGIKRGWVVLTASESAANKLSQISLLRRWK